MCQINNPKIRLEFKNSDKIYPELRGKIQKTDPTWFN